MLVVGDQAEREFYRKFGRICALGYHGVAGKDGRVLEGNAESGPESAPGGDFPVGGSAVVVGSYGRPGGNVGLPSDAGCDKEGVVVVLLVCREEQSADQLAAGDGAVVAENGIEEPYAS